MTRHIWMDRYQLTWTWTLCCVLSTSAWWFFSAALAGSKSRINIVRLYLLHHKSAFFSVLAKLKSTSPTPDEPVFLNSAQAFWALHVFVFDLFDPWHTSLHWWINKSFNCFARGFCADCKNECDSDVWCPGSPSVFSRVRQVHRQQDEEEDATPVRYAHSRLHCRSASIHVNHLLALKGQKVENRH